MNTPSKCRSCGSSDLIWLTLRNTGGAQGEPLRMPEIAYDFILGCKGCSETLRVLKAEDVVEYLTLLSALPAATQPQASAGNDVHTEHCCKKHGCKYNDPACTVAYGDKVQPFPCEDCDVKSAPAGERETIRAVFLRNGFSIKEGQTDLKPYVYAAAEELLSIARAAWQRAQQPVPKASAEQSVPDDVFEEGQWWLAELDSMAANGTPTQKRAVAVVRNLLSCWQRVQAAAVPVGWQFYQDGKWWNGDDRVKDHRKNTVAAGVPVRDVYAAPAQPAVQSEQQPVAWGAFRFGGSRSGKLYSYCETEQQIDSYITDVHRSNDSITLRKAPLYTAPIAQTAQSEVQSLREALAMFVHMAEYRLLELGTLSPEMDKCLIKGRSALAASGQKVEK